MEIKKLNSGHVNQFIGQILMMVLKSTLKIALHDLLLATTTK